MNFSGGDGGWRPLCLFNGACIPFYLLHGVF